MEENKEKISNIQPQEIVEEMQDAYLSYAMSVIVQRALPDVRDGLKPVHRRILYAMDEMGLRHSAKFTKCAGIVGDVLKKYHPHGDMAVYDSLVGMAQDFSRRYPLIDGQGNFGSIDGDSAAAYRYTEARMTKIAEELLVDIEKDTVDFRDNYDGTRKEPKVLPARIPHLLLNGTTGIAVGMSTVIPPHNLSEVVDALIYLNENPKVTNEDLTNFVKGPDFPTGGVIFNQKEIAQAYAAGKGAIIIRGSSEIIEKKEGQYQIVITEIPYQVNKSSLIETMADLVRDKKLEGVKDIRDESDREGMRIVIDLKSDTYPQKVQNFLYKHTDLQKSIHMNMLALVDGVQPQVLSLKSVLELFLKHRQEVVTRRAKFNLARAKERAHILEGLKKALDHIDAIIKIIKSSADRQIAHQNLVKKFKLTEIQANAILEMKLQSLAGLERKKIEDELKEKKNLIAELESFLKSPKKILELIKKEFIEIKEKYGGPRKTKIIIGAAKEISDEELIQEEEVIITLTRGGYIKRMDPSVYRAQHRGGKGVSGMTIKEEDVVEHLIAVNTHDNLLFFTNGGKVYQTKAYEIPEASRVAKGRSIFNFLSINQDEKITSILNYKDKEKEFKYLVMATKYGIIKKIEIEDFSQVRRSGLIAIKLKKGDLLSWVRPSKGQDEIILVTKLGQAIRFGEKDLRPMGRTASGVRGVRLKKADEVVGMDIIESEKLKNKSEKLDLLLVVTENGFGKKTELKEYKKQKRGGSGIKTAKITSKNGNIIASKILKGEEEDLIAISNKGQIIRTSLKNIANLNRATQGVRIMKLDANDKIASITLIQLKV